MIRTIRVIFCDEEHGDGEHTYPNLNNTSDGNLLCTLIDKPTVAQLRRYAKAEGWTHTRQNDFCPGCSESDAQIKRAERDQ